MVWISRDEVMVLDVALGIKRSVGKPYVLASCNNNPRAFSGGKWERRTYSVARTESVSARLREAVVGGAGADDEDEVASWLLGDILGPTLGNFCLKAA